MDRLNAISHAKSRDFLARRGVPRDSLVFSATEPSRAAEWVQGNRRQVVLGDPADRVWPVNSGIEEFVRCLEAAQQIFPYYLAGAEPEEHVQVANRLKTLLRQIDPEPYEAEGAFWASFVHDVSIGNFCTEDVDWWPSDPEKE
jgi:hypothetical protein